MHSTKPAYRRRLVRHGWWLLLLFQTWGCGDDSSPLAPTPVTPTPDLTVYRVAVTASPSGTAPGGTFDLTAGVRNDGAVASAATTLRYYRSADATVTTADTEVGTDAVDGLAAAATSDQSISLTAPSSAGTYHYGACVDAVAGEANTTNNCSGSVTVTVSETPTATSPDLTVSSSSVDDDSPAAGASFTLSATVENAGDGPAAATTLRYYRSADAMIATSDTVVGTASVGALAAGATSRGSIGLTAPAAAGTYHYGACVDPVAGESDTTDNCSASVPVTVPQPPHPPAANPDLEVQSPSASDDDLETGESFTLSATVRNAGDGPAAATTLRYYRSADATIATSDTEVGTVSLGALSAGATSRGSIRLTAPAAPGTYHYGACVDPVAGESDTTDNCSASVPVTVPQPPRPPAANPDLEVQSPSASDDDLETGESFTLSATVRNAGDGPAAATTLRYYRSADATIATSDTEVGTVSLGALSAGATSRGSIRLTAPAAPGTYHYGACVDPVADESDTTNDCSGAVTVTVAEPPPPTPPPTSPDLEVQSPSASDDDLETGESFTLSATVRNAGGGPAAATTLRYYRSADATIATADTEVGTVSLGALPAGATSRGSTRLTAPAAPGTYYYGACVDSVAGESDTANNCSASVPVTVTGPPPPPPPSSPPSPAVPDLEVLSPSASDDDLVTGESFTLTATVRNAGDGPAAATTLRYYRSADATIATSDTEVGTVSLGALSAGATSRGSIRLMAPAAPDTYYYGACVDSVAGESDTTDNCSASVPVTVPQPPDLEVQSPSAGDDDLVTGESFTLSATVRNAGNGPAAPTTLRYYRSTDATIATSDTEVATGFIGALPAGATSSGSTRLTAPAAPGTYYYGACVDAVARESDTTNNCSASVPVTVRRPPPPPDLEAYSPWWMGGHRDLQPDFPFTLFVTVRNAGDGPAAPTTLRYYRSADTTIATSDTEVGTGSIGALSAGRSRRREIQLTAPDPGTHYYGACVDAVAGESDTTNNCSGSTPVWVFEPPPPYVPVPDLEAHSPWVTVSNPAPGDTFLLIATVDSTGNAPAAPTTLRYYRSADATIATSDTEVGTISLGELWPASTRIRRTRVTAPATPGTYYYGACVDAVAGESDTTNNCTGSVTVTVSSP